MSFNEDRRILNLTDSELEDLIKKWLAKVTDTYVGFERPTASADMGRDAVGFLSAHRYDGDWHNYRPGAGQGKAFLERIMQAAHIPGLGDAIASLLSVRAELVEQIKEMDRRLRLIASQSQACEILMTIPGVGMQTSAAFAAAVDEAGRFRQSRDAGAYFGLVPRRHQSGELDWTGRITKQGDGTVRKLLYKAANSILTRSRETFALKTWAMTIAKRRGLKKARVALARRLAVIMHAMLRDGTLFQA